MTACAAPVRGVACSMDLHSGSPYWFLLHGLGAVAPPLESDRRCDVAIIGSGITGALVAWMMAKEGVRVVMLDKRDLAQGSTLASTALLQYDLDVPLHRLAPRLGWERASRAFQVGVEAISLLEATGEEVGSRVERTPSVYYTQDERTLGELEAELEHRRRAGLDVRWMSRDELERQWGIDAQGAILSSAGAQADPYDLTHKLLAAAVANGAEVYDRTTVTAIDASKHGVLLSTDRGPTVRADVVVHATGYEAAKMLPKGLVNLVSTYALVSEPIASPLPAEQRCIMWEYAEPYLYARWTGDRLLVGGEDIPFKNEQARDKLIASKAETLVQKLGRLMPRCVFEPAFAWAGTFGTTEDGLGYIGPPPDRPREWFALGFGGNGITFSMLAARMLTDRLAGRRNDDAELFRFDR